jgi:transposase
VICSLVKQIRARVTDRRHSLSLIRAQNESLSAVADLQSEFAYGPELSAIIVSEVGDLADFLSEAGFATYCGVTPVKRKSGASRGPSRLSGFTNKRLLCSVTQAAHPAATHRQESRTYYQRELAGRSDLHARTLALIALALRRTRRLHKLLRRASPGHTELVANDSVKKASTNQRAL